MKAIIKYRLHPSIIAIKKCVSSFSFSFSQVQRDEIIKEINNLEQIKQRRAQTFPLNLLRKTLIFLEIFVLKTLTTAFSTRFFQAL